MKQQILHTIYRVFNEWSENLDIVCHRGCSSCCTRNVTMTAIEGEEILRYLLDNNMAEWGAAKLATSRSCAPPSMTTNQFARACLKGRDADPETQQDMSTCPFLEMNLCRIYPARPFSCRLFVSTVTCVQGQAAVIPDYYFEAAMAVSQLIEHLGQKEYWGNMLDVLPAMLDISAYHEIAGHLDPVVIRQARLRTLTARPLPGFLLSEEEGEKIVPLLEAIFSEQVEGKRVEDILNGK